MQHFYTVVITHKHTAKYRVESHFSTKEKAERYAAQVRTEGTIYYPEDLTVKVQKQYLR